MATYRVWAEMSVLCHLDVEADSEDEALDLAEDTDGFDWEQDESTAFWEIRQKARKLD